jgi:Protein of unknown function (DUF2938)
MYLILMILTAGVLGTIVMDILNLIFSRIGIISKIEVNMIGRMAVGWIRGRFFYKHPNEMDEVSHEVLFGYITHYLIGIALAIPYIFGWDILIGGNPSLIWAIIYGIVTTVASWFFVYPTMGLGVLGLKSPKGFRVAFSSLANHLFFGIGLAVGIVVI